MNRTAIEWTDFTWNPVTGCWGPGGTAEKPNRCAYCYAAPMFNRFKRTFVPTFHPERLSEPAKIKKSSRIFVCSVADLFGDWVPDEWIVEVLDSVRGYAWHTYQFLTKNPKRLKDFNPWPRNAWVGTTVTNQADADQRLPWLLQVDAPVRFVSHEPLMGTIDIQYSYGLSDNLKVIDWAIIGAMTGPGAVEAKGTWVQGLIDQYRAAGVPLFLKDNLKWPEKIQMWP